MKGHVLGFIFSVLLVLSFSARADTSFSINAGRWQPDYSGTVGLEGFSATFDELGYDDFDHDFITAVFRHPVPLLPNLRFQHVELKSSAVGIVSNLTLNGIPLAGIAPQIVDSNLDLSFIDLTLFYVLLDNWIRLDLGVTYREFDGSADASSSFTSEKVDIDIDEPMALVFVAAKVELPFSGFYIDFNGNFLDHDRNDISDWSAGIGYSRSYSGVEWAIEFGSRILDIQSKDFDDFTDQNLDLKIDGLYLNLGLTF